MFYSAADEGGRNVVGIVLNAPQKDNMVRTTRLNDRMMGMKAIIGGVIFNLISVYARKVG